MRYVLPSIVPPTLSAISYIISINSFPLFCSYVIPLFFASMTATCFHCISCTLIIQCLLLNLRIGSTSWITILFCLLLYLGNLVILGFFLRFVDKRLTLSFLLMNPLPLSCNKCCVRPICQNGIAYISWCSFYLTFSSPNLLIHFIFHWGNFIICHFHCLTLPPPSSLSQSCHLITLYYLGCQLRVWYCQLLLMLLFIN